MYHVIKTQSKRKKLKLPTWISQDFPVGPCMTMAMELQRTPEPALVGQVSLRGGGDKRTYQLLKWPWDRAFCTVFSEGILCLGNPSATAGQVVYVWVNQPTISIKFLLAACLLFYKNIKAMGNHEDFSNIKEGHEGSQYRNQGSFPLVG